MREYDEADEPTDDDYDHTDRRGRGGERFPPGVKAAGIIWIVFGVLGLLGQGVSLVANGGAGGNAAGPICGALFALAFLIVGVQTIKGTAKGSLGNGIGSIVFSLLYLAAGGLFLLGAGFVAAAAPPNANQQEIDLIKRMALLFGLLFAVLGVMLFVAGVLGIMGNTAYKEWREASGLARPKRPRRRRRDDDDDYDDRPRRPRDDDKDYEDRPRRPRDDRD